MTQLSEQVSRLVRDALQLARLEMTRKGRLALDCWAAAAWWRPG